MFVNSINPEDGTRGIIDNSLAPNEDLIKEKFSERETSAETATVKRSNAGIRRLKSESQNQSNLTDLQNKAVFEKHLFFAANEPLSISYKDLVCTEDDKRKIYYIIHSLGNDSYLTLLMNIKKFRKVGDEVRHVHPLCFLGYVYTTFELKKDMKVVMGAYFIRNEFLKEVVPVLEREYSNNNIYPFLADFSKEIHVSEDLIRPFVDKRNWEGLIKFLNTK